MRFANDWDIQRYVDFTDDPSLPNLHTAAVALQRLADWADANSDGWAYWPKPVRSAARVIDILEEAERAWRTGGFLADISDSELTKALAPVKSFLTRQGAAYSEVL